MFTASFTPWLHRRGTQALTVFALLSMLVHLGLRLNDAPRVDTLVPLWALLVIASPPLLARVGWKFTHGGGGADLLGALELVLAIVLEEYLAASLVVLMLAGGEALEAYAQRRASSALEALAARMPSITHRRNADGSLSDISLNEVAIGDTLLVFPGESCPVDGAVAEGHGSMDESYLTGEPYRVSKAPGAAVLSGAINGHNLLVITAEKLPQDSRYAKIMEVMRDAEQKRPALRRIGDKVGLLFTPIALLMAGAAWLYSNDPKVFLAVLIVATPCPLLIAIPVAIVSAISIAAKRGIIIRDPAVLERLPTCRVAIFDKTGTLTHGKPIVSEVVTAPGMDAGSLLRAAASLERYSKHPLASAILEAAEKRGLPLLEAEHLAEKPGQGLVGTLQGKEWRITHRKQLLAEQPEAAALLPATAMGLECVVLRGDTYAGLVRFRDAPRAEGRKFIDHLAPAHAFDRVLLVSGDRRTEVEYLANELGIDEPHAEQTPEQKLALVRAETKKARTLFVGDGVNDAPALAAATVGLAFGHHSSVTSEAAGAVILDNTLHRVDELLHLSILTRQTALRCALGGMAASVVGMGLAAMGMLSPVQGALLQEIIDLIAIAYALRLTFGHRIDSDFG